MKKLLLVIMLVAFASVSFAGVGVKGGYIKGTATGFDDYSGFALGIDYKYELGPFFLAPELIYFNTSHTDISDATVTDVALSINAVFKSPVGIYGGAGIGYHSLTTDFSGTSETNGKIGLNFIAGYEFPLPMFSPFIEGRYSALQDDFSHFMILAGVNFAL